MITVVAVILGLAGGLGLAAWCIRKKRTETVGALQGALSLNIGAKEGRRCKPTNLTTHREESVLKRINGRPRALVLNVSRP